MISFLQKRLAKNQHDPSGIKVHPTPGNTPAGIPGKIYLCLALSFIACWLVIFISLPGSCGATMANEVGKVRYVDSKGSNFLFRGASPLTGNPPEFDYEGLKQALKNATPSGVKFPEKYYLIDVNLLQSENSGDGVNPGDLDNIVAEYSFFKNDSSRGEIHVWGMRGTGINATCKEFDGETGVYLTRHLDDWLNDKLVERVRCLRDWLEFGNRDSSNPRLGLPVVIYMHCAGGCDRTGELSGAYYLRYLGYSWKKVNEINRDICGRPFGCNNYRATQWYCRWLNQELKRSELNWREKYECSGSDQNPCQPSAVTATKVIPEPVTAAFCSGVIYNGGQKVCDAVRKSGFNTVLLWCIHLYGRDGHAPNGDIYFNDDLIIHDGSYVGKSKDWPKYLATLKKAPTSVNRVEVSVGAWGTPDFEAIRDLIAAQGTGPKSILYRNFKVLKSITGADAVDYDDESCYDVRSMAAFGKMCGTLGYKVTFCPYCDEIFWRNLKDQLSPLVDRCYLQCYAGGTGNKPEEWQQTMGMKVIPGLSVGDSSPSKFQKLLTGWYKSYGIVGGFLWNYDDTPGARVAQYVNAIKNSFR